ncbi:Aminopeptidase C [Mycoplasmopsis maculosa]|uniref:Aminopeptidase n=1 Tax=Mycoplasmopsis maculosa TaxID=114885 RepID=A0A449B4P3_9BACT|nr:C1 family peptidase [Mycoplasmopsis maculosa]VEU75562.1 Aminopeptidase C [Mycoplasmopsis maculosa]
MILNNKEIKKFYEKYISDKNNKVIENAITKNGIFNSTINNDIYRKHNHEFNVQVKKGGMTNQKSSGRCWIFSSTNMLKTKILEKLNVESFEFSENYLFFYDKLEKANTFLELVIETADKPYDNRLLQNIMSFRVSDGGYWEWAQGLIKKYGLVPKSIMDDTYDAQNSNGLNQVLDFHLLSAAHKIREAFKNNENIEELRKIKHDALEIVFQINAKSLGLPPIEFTFEYRDKDKNFHKIENITPLDFLKEYIGFEFLDKINLIHDPRDIYPKNRVYHSKYYKSVIEEKCVQSLNTNINEIKEAIVKSLQAGIPVWFDCDVSLFIEPKAGIFDTDIYNFEDSLKIWNSISKKDRVNFKFSTPNHAMTFVGVDLDKDGKPIKWEVENSWGEDRRHKGYFSMSDKWFDEFCFGAIVDPKFVNKEVLKGLNEPAIELEPWDPLA